MLVFALRPVVSCHDKALFLLKFAGLSQVDQDGGTGREEKVDNGGAVSTVGRLKQQVTKPQTYFVTSFPCPSSSSSAWGDRQSHAESQLVLSWCSVL